VERETGARVLSAVVLCALSSFSPHRFSLSLSSFSLLGIANRTEHRLTKLSVVGCKRFDIDCIDVLTYDAVTQALRNQNLVYLDLSFCTAVDDEAIEHLSSRCKQLITLKLMGCAKITDASPVVIADRIRGLQKLSLAHCMRLTDAATESLVATLWMEELDLSNCSRITDRSLRAIAERAPGIIELRLRWCVKVTTQGVEALGATCNVLRILDLSACDDVSAECLRVLKKSNAKLTVLIEDEEGEERKFK